jgi:hypothetical protein
LNAVLPAVREPDIAWYAQRMLHLLLSLALQTPPPPPAPELDQLKVLDGKWSCSGKTVETPFGTAHAVSATMDNKIDLNGYWRLWRYAEKKTKENPSPYVMASFVGYDREKKQLVRTDIDGLGMVTHLFARGWDDDKLVFEGTVGPARVGFRETLMKKSDKEIHAQQEMSGADGAWIMLSETVCKKAK